MHAKLIEFDAMVEDWKEKNRMMVAYCGGAYSAHIRAFREQRAELVKSVKRGGDVQTPKPVDIHAAWQKINDNPDCDCKVSPSGLSASYCAPCVAGRKANFNLLDAKVAELQAILDNLK